MSWQRMETAPKDGTKIWALSECGFIQLIKWGTVKETEDSFGFTGWIDIKDAMNDIIMEASPLTWMPYESIPEPEEWPDLGYCE